METPISGRLIINTVARPRGASRGNFLGGLVALMAFVTWGGAGTAFAWVYPEHRDIALLAVEKLDPARRAVFDGLWREARIPQEKRLCEQGADTAQGLNPPCIDWAA